jgi:hypothetical protein
MCCMICRCVSTIPTIAMPTFYRQFYHVYISSRCIPADLSLGAMPTFHCQCAATIDLILTANAMPHSIWLRTPMRCHTRFDSDGQCAATMHHCHAAIAMPRSPMSIQHRQCPPFIANAYPRLCDSDRYFPGTIDSTLDCPLPHPTLIANACHNRHAAHCHCHRHCPLPLAMPPPTATVDATAIATATAHCHRPLPSLLSLILLLTAHCH